MFVLDCSVAMSWCFEDEGDNLHSKHLLGLLKETPAIVPTIWHIEVCNVLLVAERKKRISAENLSDFLRFLQQLPIESDLGLGILFNEQLIKIAREHKLTAYDASYIELALRFKAPLATYDKELHSAAETYGIKVM